MIASYFHNMIQGNFAIPKEAFSQGNGLRRGPFKTIREHKLFSTTLLQYLVFCLCTDFTCQ